MALSKFSSKLSERLALKLKNRRKRKWVSEFRKQRLTFGEFCRLYRATRVHPDKFIGYLTMSRGTFDTF
jgi:hypothetical protein